MPQRCAREGCPRAPRAGHDYCTLLCANVDQEFAYLQKLLTHNPHHPLATDAWTTLAEVGDTLSRYRSLVRGIHRADQRKQRSMSDPGGTTPHPGA